MSLEKWDRSLELRLHSLCQMLSSVTLCCTIFWRKLEIRKFEESFYCNIFQPHDGGLLHFHSNFLTNLHRLLDCICLYPIKIYMVVIFSCRNRMETVLQTLNFSWFAVCPKLIWIAKGGRFKSHNSITYSLINLRVRKKLCHLSDILCYDNCQLS